MERGRFGAVADGLTMSRLVIAVALVPAAWALSLEVVAVLLPIAWLTDVADGRVARAGGRPGRLGRWDFAVDASVGAALVIGLTGSGSLPVWVGAACLLVFGTFVAMGNLAGGMLLQVSGYLPVGVLLWTHRPTFWFLPFVTAAIIGLLDWNRLVRVQVPAFFDGVAGIVRRDRTG